MIKPTIGVIGGEGEKNGRIEWPWCVRLFDNTPSDAKVAAAQVVSGVLKELHYVRKGYKSEVLKAINRGGVHALWWDKSPAELAKKLGVENPKPAPPPRPPQPSELLDPPVIVVAPVEPPPKSPIDDAPAPLVPKWTADEVEAFVIAFENCDGNAAVFHAKFNELSDRRERTAAELHEALHRIALARNLEPSAAFKAALHDLARGRMPRVDVPKRTDKPKPSIPQPVPVVPKAPEPAAPTVEAVAVPVGSESKAPLSDDGIRRLAAFAKFMDIPPEVALKQFAMLVMGGGDK